MEGESEQTELGDLPDSAIPRVSKYTASPADISRSVWTTRKHGWLSLANLNRFLSGAAWWVILSPINRFVSPT